MKTHEQFLKDFEKRGNKNLIIIGTYQGCETRLKVKCKICNEELLITPHGLLKGQGCYYCSNRKIKKDLNSFGALYPELLDFFVNKEEAFKHTPGSKEKALLECPDCHTNFYLPYYIIKNKGIICPMCNTLTYPNKFLRIFLKELPDITNVSFEKTYKDNGKIIRYDAFFIYDNRNFVIEINGGQHYKSCSFNNYNVQLQEKQDQFKKEYAEKNNFIFLSIDASKSDFFFIKNNILNSDLSNFFNLEKINRNNILINISNYSILKNICNDYENNLMRIEELSNKYSIERHVVTRYLKLGKEIGLCKSYHPGKNRQGVKIEAYDDKNILIGIYPSIKICADKLNEKYHLNFLKNSISHVLSGAQKSHRNFYFKKVILNE